MEVELEKNLQDLVRLDVGNLQLILRDVYGKMKETNDRVDKLEKENKVQSVKLSTLESGVGECRDSMSDMRNVIVQLQNQLAMFDDGGKGDLERLSAKVNDIDSSVEAMRRSLLDGVAAAGLTALEQRVGMAEETLVKTTLEQDKQSNALKATERDVQKHSRALEATERVLTECAHSLEGKATIQAVEGKGERSKMMHNTARIDILKESIDRLAAHVAGADAKLQGLLMGDLCELCEEQKRSVQCHECAMQFCEACDGEVHEPTSMQSHHRSKLANAANISSLPQRVRVKLTVGHNNLLLSTNVGEDAMIGLFEKLQGSQDFDYLDRSEILENPAAPSFEKTFVIEYATANDRELRLKLYHVTQSQRDATLADKDAAGGSTLSSVGALSFGLNSVAMQPGIKHRFKLHNDGDAAVEKMLAAKNSTLWVRAEVEPIVEGVAAVTPAPSSALGDLKKTMAVSPTDTLVEEAVRQGVCTRKLLGDRYAEQEMWRCETCGEDDVDLKEMCVVCKDACHRHVGHVVVSAGRFSNMCACGDSEQAKACALRGTAVAASAPTTTTIVRETVQMNPDLGDLDVDSLMTKAAADAKFRDFRSKLSERDALIADIDRQLKESDGARAALQQRLDELLAKWTMFDKLATRVTDFEQDMKDQLAGKQPLEDPATKEALALQSYVDMQISDLVQRLRKLKADAGKNLRVELQRFENDVIIMMEDAQRAQESKDKNDETAMGRIHFRCVTCDHVTSSQPGPHTRRFMLATQDTNRDPSLVINNNIQQNITHNHPGSVTINNHGGNNAIGQIGGESAVSPTGGGGMTVQQGEALSLYGRDGKIYKGREDSGVMFRPASQFENARFRVQYKQANGSSSSRPGSSAGRGSRGQRQASARAGEASTAMQALNGGMMPQRPGTAPTEQMYYHLPDSQLPSEVPPGGEHTIVSTPLPNNLNGSVMPPI